MIRTILTFISIEHDENRLREKRGKKCVFHSQWRGRREREGAGEEETAAAAAAGAEAEEERGVGVI